MAIKKLPAFRKLTPSGNSSNTLKPLVDQGHCCGDSEKAVVTYANTANNIGSSALESIEIDGTLYPFTTPADTLAELEEGIYEAFEAAGYAEVFGVAVVVSGSASAAVATIKTTATLTKFVNAAASDVALTAQ